MSTRTLAAGCAALLAACTTGPVDLDLRLANPAPPVASPARPLLLTATATNGADGRVEWGVGSSTCQLDLVVSVGGRTLGALLPRACTDDLVPQGLDPHASRSEQIPWGAQVRDGGVTTTLPPGRYLVRARAGSAGTSAPLQVTVE